MPDNWELYYWGPNVVGRAEFIRLIFEELGMKYKEINKGVPAVFTSGQLEGYPTRAPPMIKNGEFQLSQMPVICMYLGKKYGLYPDNEADEYHAMQVMATISDYITEGRLCFHGVNWQASYFTQQEETKPYIKHFTTNRIPNFLNHFETALSRNDGGKGYLFGTKLTYVDLALLHILRATESQFPEEWNALGNIPLLKAFKVRISERPNLAAYFKSDRCSPFEGNSMM
ncbi:glutathione S-transferase P 2-like [Liolophura sinensis]|uniref:glutathione S-transferase P 2-like n=1 Tax=Liolophura sinensis TaxID=3198878 RepID=UPI003158E8B9